MKNCCTYWFKGWWNEFCCRHDKDYYESGRSRKNSDARLFTGVFTSLDNTVRDLKLGKFRLPTQLIFTLLGRVISLPVATVMWVGVRIGGRSRYERKQGGS